MAKVSIYRNKRKKLKNDVNPIQLRLIHKRKIHLIGLGMNGEGFKGTTKTFDDNAGRFNDQEPDYQLKNAIISAKLAEAENILQRLALDNIPFTFERFEKMFVKQPKRNSIISFFDAEIKRLDAANRFGYAIPYKVTRDHLVNFNGSDRLQFDQVNYQFLVNFEAYLMSRTIGKIKKRPIEKTTIHNYMRVIRTVYNSAIKAGVCEEREYPFYSRMNLKGYSLAHLKHESHKRAILIEQVRKLKDHKLFPVSSIYDYRNYWLFMYYCRGMNFADVADLEWSDIKEGRLAYNRNKNNRAYNLLLIPEALEILEYYKGKGIGNYVFPIHKSLYNTEDRYMATKNCNKNMNAAMNRLAKRLDIDANLTTYVARHSWATGLKNRGYSIAVISEGLGHNSEKTTAKYLKQFENDVLDEAGKDVL